MLNTISTLEVDWDNFTIAIIFYGIVAIMCVIVGVLAIKYGYKLYSTGVGLKPDGTTVDYKKVSVKLKSVGSVLMFTSVAWGVLAYVVLPELKEGDVVLAEEMSNENHNMETVVAELSNNDFITIYENSIKKDSMATIASWTILAQEDNTGLAKAAVSYGYGEGIGFPKNIDSSRVWLYRAIEEQGYNVQDETITAVELDSIYAVIFNPS